jgi:hypothetical protein
MSLLVGSHLILRLDHKGEVYKRARHDGAAAAVTRSVFGPAYRRLRDWLVAARRGQGLTQAELAQRLGRHQSFVSKYERGERRLDFVEVVEIAEALHVDACDLVAELRRPGR